VATHIYKGRGLSRRGEKESEREREGEIARERYIYIYTTLISFNNRVRDENSARVTRSNPAGASAAPALYSWLLHVRREKVNIPEIGGKRERASSSSRYIKLISVNDRVRDKNREREARSNPAGASAPPTLCSWL
jgi:hypothetical protein